MTGDEFAAAMQPLGPWGPQPIVAVAVSGGADSMAACLLTRDWTRARGGEVLALVVDHGLRVEAGAEARLTCDRLAQLGVKAVLLTLHDLRRGAGMAARARAARHAALEDACAERGIVHLLFGHHARDQAETVLIRMLSRSQPPGLAGMAALLETPHVRKLRPLLGMAPVRLRATLTAAGVQWVEDPSNVDPTQQRARLRVLRGDTRGDSAATRALGDSAFHRGLARAALEAVCAAELAGRVTIFPDGHALLSPGPIRAEALAALLAMLSGSARSPSLTQVASLAAQPGPATLGGVRVLPAGRLGNGWLLVREAAACAATEMATPGVTWDGRFRLLRLPDGVSPGSNITVGAWGSQARGGRNLPPMVVLRSMPVLRRGDAVICTLADLLTASPPCIIFTPACAIAGDDLFLFAHFLLGIWRHGRARLDQWPGMRFPGRHTM